MKNYKINPTFVLYTTFIVALFEYMDWKGGWAGGILVSFAIAIIAGEGGKLLCRRIEKKNRTEDTDIIAQQKKLIEIRKIALYRKDRYN